MRRVFDWLLAYALALAVFASLAWTAGCDPLSGEPWQAGLDIVSIFVAALFATLITEGD